MNVLHFLFKDDESIPVELRDTVEYRELMTLKRLRKQKLKMQYNKSTEHVGFKVRGA